MDYVLAALVSFHTNEECNTEKGSTLCRARKGKVGMYIIMAGLVVVGLLAGCFVIMSYKKWRKDQGALFEENNLHRKSTVFEYSVSSWVAPKNECNEDLEMSISEESYDSEEESEEDREASKTGVNNTHAFTMGKNKLEKPPKF